MKVEGGSGIGGIVCAEFSSMTWLCKGCVLSWLFLNLCGMCCIYALYALTKLLK